MLIPSSLRRWLARYGAAEVVGSAFAVGGALIVRAFSHSDALAAYAGMLGENIGYYGVIVLRDVATALRAARATGATFGPRDLVVVGRELAIEFGPAELFDSALVRPLMMALGMRWLGVGVGVLAGKVAADLLFYVPVILTHEARRVRRTSPPG